MLIAEKCIRGPRFIHSWIRSFIFDWTYNLWSLITFYSFTVIL